MLNDINLLALSQIFPVVAELRLVAGVRSALGTKLGLSMRKPAISASKNSGILLSPHVKLPP